MFGGGHVRAPRGPYAIHAAPRPDDTTSARSPELSVTDKPRDLAGRIHLFPGKLGLQLRSVGELLATTLPQKKTPPWGGPLKMTE